MNGWKRLGVVLATLLGVPIFLIVYSNSRNVSGYINAAVIVDVGMPQEVSGVLSRQVADDDRFRQCHRSTIKIDPIPYVLDTGEAGYKVSCHKTFVGAGIPAIAWALLPATVIWVMGSIAAWVIAGFRRNVS
jgi:hypothetical protein